MHDSFEIWSPSAWGLELSRMLKYDNGLTNLMICPIPAPDLLVAHDARSFVHLWLFLLIDHTAAAEIFFPTTMAVDLPGHEEDEEALVMASESARDF